jgi:hypothetical protein
VCTGFRFGPVNRFEDKKPPQQPVGGKVSIIDQIDMIEALAIIRELQPGIRSIGQEAMQFVFNHLPIRPDVFLQDSGTAGMNRHQPLLGRNAALSVLGREKIGEQMPQHRRHG